MCAEFVHLSLKPVPPGHVQPNRYLEPTRFLPLIEHLEVVFVQLDMKQIPQVQCVPLSLFDVKEPKHLKHNLLARKHWTFVLVLSFLCSTSGASWLPQEPRKLD